MASCFFTMEISLPSGFSEIEYITLGHGIYRLSTHGSAIRLIQLGL